MVSEEIQVVGLEESPDLICCQKVEMSEMVLYEAWSSHYSLCTLKDIDDGLSKSLGWLL